MSKSELIKDKVKEYLLSGNVDKDSLSMDLTTGRHIIKFKNDENFFAVIPSENYLFVDETLTFPIDFDCNNDEVMRDTISGIGLELMEKAKVEMFDHWLENTTL